MSSSEATELISELRDEGWITEDFEWSDRYSRHRLYYHMLGVRKEPQETLSKLRVGLLGMGGIGSQVATLLTAAGVGQLVVTDGDVVELSNLTRQMLYSEEDCGTLKVEAAAKNLRRIRSDIRVETIASPLNAMVAQDVASRVDIVILSADKPSDVHSWTNSACMKAGVPYCNTGYIEGHGIVGPFIIPGKTPCYECIRADAESLPDDGGMASGAFRVQEYNPAFQTPSYGPLNAMVSAVQVNEVLRWALGLPVVTMGRRLIIDSRNYDITWEDFRPVEECPTCGRKGGNGHWTSLAAQYNEERKTLSANAAVLDPLIWTELRDAADKHVADVGAGSGVVTKFLLESGAKVDAFEPDEKMRDLLMQETQGFPADKLTIGPFSIETLPAACQGYDIVTCLNVLDWVEDLDGAFQQLKRLLKPGGRLVLSLPHPMKDLGGWKKKPSENGWEYEHFLLDDYMAEGPCLKSREDHLGRVRAINVPTYHRKISTYLQGLLEHGFSIRKVAEPGPSSQSAASAPAVFKKGSRVPYFFVVVATLGEA